MSTYLLHIDTAISTATAAISVDGHLVALRTHHQQKDHSAFIHPAIQELLNSVGITPSNLHAIAVTEGPGSYTGLRVGLSTAKGLCFALQKPLITINNLWLLAAASKSQLDIEQALYCPMIDARRMEVFTALYDHSLREVLSPAAQILDEHSFSKEVHQQPVIFSGNGAEKFKKIISHAHARFVEIADTTTPFVHKSYEKFKASDFASLVDSTPVYAKEFYNV